MYQPGKVANPARGQLNRENNIPLSPCEPKNLVSRDGFSLSMEMDRLTRDGTAEPVSRDQILRHARGQGNIIFPVQLTTSRIGNLTRLIHTLLYVMTTHIPYSLLPDE